MYWAGKISGLREAHSQLSYIIKVCAGTVDDGNGIEDVT